MKTSSYRMAVICLTFQFFCLLNIEAKQLSRIGINVDSAKGIVAVFVDNEQKKNISIIDPEYQKAVVENQLDTFFSIEGLKFDKRGRLPAVVKIEHFQNVGQIRGTCAEAAVMEWANYFSKETNPNIPIFHNVALFNTAIRRMRFHVDLNNTLVKYRTDKNGNTSWDRTVDSDKNRPSWREIQTWSKRYLNIFYAQEIDPSEGIAPYDLNTKVILNLNGHIGYEEGTSGGLNSEDLKFITQHLLLGHGVILNSTWHAMCAIGTEMENISISTWGEIFVKKFPESPDTRLRNRISCLFPLRNSDGLVLTNVPFYLPLENTVSKSETETEFLNEVGITALKSSPDYQEILRYWAGKLKYFTEE